MESGCIMHISAPRPPRELKLATFYSSLTLDLRKVETGGAGGEWVRQK